MSPFENIFYLFPTYPQNCTTRASLYMVLPSRKKENTTFCFAIMCFCSAYKTDQCYSKIKKIGINVFAIFRFTILWKLYIEGMHVHQPRDINIISKKKTQSLCSISLTTVGKFPLLLHVLSRIYFNIKH